METEGNQAYIPSQTDGVTYVYTVNSTSLKEDIVMNYLTDQQEFTYELNVGNQYEATLSDGILYVQDKDDKEVYYTFSAPFMTDREGNVNTNILIDLTKKNGKYIVTIQPDQDWLKEPLRAYPVVIGTSGRRN